MAVIEVFLGDITRLQVDAVVNAANSSLLGGGGVDGAIHRAAGPELHNACKQLGGCPTGEVRITPGFNLPAQYVIHTVGPVWAGGDKGEADHLARCYRNSLRIAEQYAVQSIAFPAISCGVYRYPPAEAVHVAVETLRAQLFKGSCLQRVVFCCYSREMECLYRRELGQT